jgi:hypothetical protein
VQREDCGVYRVLTRSVRAITVPVSAGQSGYLLRQIPSLSSKSHPHMTIPPQVLSYSRGDSADPLSQISTPLFSLEKGKEKGKGKDKGIGSCETVSTSYLQLVGYVIQLGCSSGRKLCCHLFRAMLKSTLSTPPTSFAIRMMRASFDNILPVPDRVDEKRNECRM